MYILPSGCAKHSLEGKSTLHRCKSIWKLLDIS